MALYLVGDIQGCFDELQLLLQKVGFNRNDILWLTGDLVARGPKSLETLRWVMQQSNVFTVLGNHDLHLLAISEGIHTAKPRDRTQAILNAKDLRSMMSWLRYQPLMLGHSEHPLVMTHAGIYPGWSIKEAHFYAAEVEEQLVGRYYQSLLRGMYSDTPSRWDPNLLTIARWRFIINAFTRMRFCTPKGELDLKSKAPPETVSDQLVPWFQLHHQRQQTDVTLAFGHWAALMGKTQPGYLGLDTGCVWGNYLTLYCWETGETITQSSLY